MVAYLAAHHTTYFQELVSRLAHLVCTRAMGSVLFARLTAHSAQEFQPTA